MVLLALAANTSFGGLPLQDRPAADGNCLPHMFGLRDQTARCTAYWVVTLALREDALLVGTPSSDPQALGPAVRRRRVVGSRCPTWAWSGMECRTVARRSPARSTGRG